MLITPLINQGSWREVTPVSFFWPPSCYWKPLAAFSQALLVLSLECVAVLAPWQNIVKWNTKEISSNVEKYTNCNVRSEDLFFSAFIFKYFGLIVTRLTLCSRAGRGRWEEQAEDPGQWLWSHLRSILLFTQVIMFLAYFIRRKSACEYMSLILKEIIHIVYR